MARKKWSELDLMDNELMDIVASDPNVGVPFCRRMLSVLLDREIGEIRVHAQRYFPGSTSDKRGVRLDVEVEEIGENKRMVRVYDIEPHHADKTDDYPRMMRFRQAKIDSGKMEKGDDEYKHLPDLYVILISDFDLFGKDYMVYTFKHRCVELPEIPYEDGVNILYFNTLGTKGGSQSIRNMLNYLQRSEVSSVVDNATAEIDGYVQDVRSNPEAEGNYMTLGDLIDREVEEAVEETTRKVTQQVTHSTKVEAILELLEDADGEITESLKARLEAISDPAQLKRLLKWAARVGSVTEFEEKLYGATHHPGTP